MVGRYLAAKLAADTAAGAGDHNHPVLQSLADVLGFQFNLLAAQQVRDLNIAQLADADLAKGELVESGDGFTWQTSLSQDADDFSHSLGGSRGHGDDGF